MWTLNTELHPWLRPDTASAAEIVDAVQAAVAGDFGDAWAHVFDMFDWSLDAGFQWAPTHDAGGVMRPEAFKRLASYIKEFTPARPNHGDQIEHLRVVLGEDALLRAAALNNAVLFSSAPQGSDFWNAHYARLERGEPLSHDATLALRVWLRLLEIQRDAVVDPAAEPTPADAPIGFNRTLAARALRWDCPESLATFVRDWSPLPQGREFWDREHDRCYPTNPTSAGLSDDARRALAGWLGVPFVTREAEYAQPLHSVEGWNEPAWNAGERRLFGRYMGLIEREIDNGPHAAHHEQMFPGDERDEKYDARDYGADAEALRRLRPDWPIIAVARRNFARGWHAQWRALSTPAPLRVEPVVVEKTLAPLKRVNITERERKLPGVNGALAGCDCSACVRLRKDVEGATDAMTARTTPQRVARAQVEKQGRTFGVEIECIVPYSKAAERQGLAWDRWLAASLEEMTGMPFNRGQYSGEQWGIKSDGSLNTAGLDRSRTWLALEVVSPVLRPADGYEKLTKVCNALISLGTKVNASCGLHVHIGAVDLNAGERRNLLSQFIRYERFFDLILPASRRTTKYAASMRSKISATRNASTKAAEHAILRLLAAKTEAEVNALFAANHHDRMANALGEHGTIEFRQHSGTINPEKVVNWVQLVSAFFEKAKDKPALPFYSRRLTAEEEMEKFFETFAIERPLRAYYRKRHAALYANPDNDD